MKSQPPVRGHRDCVPPLPPPPFLLGLPPNRLYFYPLRRGPATFPESPPRQQSEELWQRRQRRRCRDQGTGVTLTLAGDDNRTNGEIGGTGAGSSELGAAVGGGDAGSGYGNPTPAVVTAEAAKRGEKRPLPPKKRFRGLMADRFQHPFDLVGGAPCPAATV